MCLSSFKFVPLSPKTHLFCVESVLTVQDHSRSSRVDDCGNNLKRVWRVCSPIVCGPILHRFWDTVSYWLKIAYFPHPTLTHRSRRRMVMGWTRIRSLCSVWNFSLKLTTRKLESKGYPPMKTAWSYSSLSRFGMIPACDGRTDRQRDRIYHS